MGVFRTSFRARTAPVSQHCTHDFVLVSLLVCGEDRSSSRSRLPRLLYFNFASVQLHPWARLLLTCWKKGWMTVSRKRITHTHVCSCDSMNPRLSPNGSSITPANSSSRMTLIVTVQPYSVTSGCHLSVSNNPSCHAPYSKPSSDCLGAITDVEEFGTNWDLF